MATASRSRPALGVTLIELLAALAILGVLLAGVLTTKSRLQRQYGTAERTLAAVDAADALLMGWRQGAGIPTGETGVVPGRTGMAWRTFSVSNEDAEAMGAGVVRLEVFDVARPDEPLASVELLAPLEPRNVEEAVQ